MPAMPRDYLLQILEDDGDRAPQETGTAAQGEKSGRDHGQVRRRRRGTRRQRETGKGRNCTAGECRSETNILTCAVNTSQEERRKRYGAAVAARGPQERRGSAPAQARRDAQQRQLARDRQFPSSGDVLPQSRSTLTDTVPERGKGLHRHASRSKRRSGDGAGTSCNQGRNRPARLPGPVPTSGECAYRPTSGSGQAGVANKRPSRARRRSIKDRSSHAPMNDRPSFSAASAD